MTITDQAIAAGWRRADNAAAQAISWARRWRLPWLAATAPAAWFAATVTAGMTGAGLGGALKAGFVAGCAIPAGAAYLVWTSPVERHRRAAKRIGWRWARACHLADAYPKATNPAVTPRLPRLERVQESHGGNLHATVVMPGGMTYDSVNTTRLRQLAPLIATHLQPTPKALDVAPTDDLARARLTVVYWRAFDHETGPIAYTPGGGIGVRETGEAVRLHIPGEHTMVVGQTGAGKSSWLNAAIAEALHHEHRPDLWGVDLKRTELALWADAFDRLALDEHAADAILRDLIRELIRRQKALEGRGRKWEPGCGFPPLLVVIDELTQVVWQPWPGEDPKAPSQRRAQVIRLAAMGRALGIQFLAATQEPIAEVVGRIRVNMQTTICCRVRTETDAQTALGPGLAAELRPELLTAPGSAWVVPATTRPVVARAKWLDDPDIAQIAAAHRRGGA